MEDATAKSPQFEIPERIWLEPLTDQERAIIAQIFQDEATVEKRGDQARRWMNHVMKCYDALLENFRVVLQDAIDHASSSERWIAIPHEQWRNLLAAATDPEFRFQNNPKDFIMRSVEPVITISDVEQAFSRIRSRRVHLSDGLTKEIIDVHDGLQRILAYEIQNQNENSKRAAPQDDNIMRSALAEGINKRIDEISKRVADIKTIPSWRRTSVVSGEWLTNYEKDVHFLLDVIRGVKVEL